MSWWRISRKWLERGSELSIITSVAISGVSCDDLVSGRVPPDRVADERQQVLGVDPLGFGQEAGLAEQPVQRRAHRPRRPPAGRRARAPPARASMRLNSPKSRNATRPSSSSRKLPGCGSPENWRWRYRQPRKKRNTISPMRSRSACERCLELLEADAVDELADEHALARERADDFRHHDERVPARRCARASAGSAPRARSRAPPRSARGSPRRSPCTSSPGVIRLNSRMIMSRFCMSARTAPATPGYWTLTATSRPSRSVAR